MPPTGWQPVALRSPRSHSTRASRIFRISSAALVLNTACRRASIALDHDAQPGVVRNDLAILFGEGLPDSHQHEQEVTRATHLAHCVDALEGAQLVSGEAILPKQRSILREFLPRCGTLLIIV